MKSIRKIVAAFTVIAALIAFGVGAEATETNVSSGLTIKGHGLAVHGYDVVAYFTEGRPMVGNAKFSAVFKNATYRFISKDNLKAFRADPERYAPQFGGYCAYGVAVGAKFDGDPRLWKIVEGKLYLNLNEKIQKTWEKNIPGNIRKANGSWTKIANRLPTDLT